MRDGKDSMNTKQPSDKRMNGMEKATLVISGIGLLLALFLWLYMEFAIG